MTTDNTLQNDLNIIKELVYDKCGFEFSNLKINSESVEYGACSFELNGYKVVHRISKVTPTKTGQFVTIWKRNKDGKTEPLDISDHFDFVVITSRSGDTVGQFIFPKSVLAQKGIISQNGKGGKRGIRVYPSWDTPANKQAETTQKWQTNYFVTMKSGSPTMVNLIIRLFNKQTLPAENQ